MGALPASGLGIGWHHTRFDSEEFIKVNGLDRGHFKLGAGAQAWMEGTDSTLLRRTYISRHMPVLVLWLYVGLGPSSGTSVPCLFVIRRFICLTFVSLLDLLHGLFALPCGKFMRLSLRPPNFCTLLNRAGSAERLRLVTIPSIEMLHHLVFWRMSGESTKAKKAFLLQKQIPTTPNLGHTAVRLELPFSN